MSIDAAASDASTPCTETSIFEEEWKGCGGSRPFEGLEAVAEFNASFGQDNRSDIDPQLLSTPKKPSTTQYPLQNVRNQQTKETTWATAEQASTYTFINGACTTPQMGNPSGTSEGGAMSSVLDPQCACPDCSGVVVDFHQPHLLYYHGTIPHYYPSVELHNANGLPTQLDTNPDLSVYHQFHRRSISEPPRGPTSASFQHYQYQPATDLQAPMTFRRADRVVGTQTRPQELTRLKPSPRDRRQSRQQPPSINKRDVQKGRQRDGLRRARAQTVRAPTSVPSSPMPPRKIVYMDDSPTMVPYQGSSSQVSPLEFVSTRICTPTPSPERVLSPSLDLGETMELTNSSAHSTHDNVAMLSIPISIEQLQALITEAVQKAVTEMKKDVASSEDGKVGHDGGS